MSASALGRIFLIMLCVVALLLVAAWAFQRRLIYLPDRTPPPPAHTVLENARDVRLLTTDGLELGGWYVPAIGGSGITVLVANGNAGNRLDRAALAEGLSAAGFAVLLFDYRGYGGNPGSPSEDGLALDVRAAHRYLVEERQVPSSRLLYFGESLGAGVVAELATDHPPAGLLLRSPFADLAGVGREHYPFLPVGLLLKDRFQVVDHIARVSVPTTVVYGTADTIVPASHSERVAAAAGGPVERVVLPRVGHNDAEMFGPRIVDAVEALAVRAIADR
ncbi:alpha/beta hydrolase [Aldersonia kunmingensis]|uniref:alpha/beta hydrolase n=1 Tax=Aldersonia kunmingensis TaxID=408066 RepID=UPI00082FDE30|nr:alpha/beta hydrolase [Aldersonia kunmingensis]